jgi:hypothetical protein
MSTKNFTEYSLPKDAYAAFDATTLKELIINRLNENEVFADQTFEGSNINAFIDVVAYMYHVLLFYLNNTSSESTFTTAELYSNMNKIVSNIGYKPTGRQTSLAVVGLSGTGDLLPNTYTIPRFSSITINGISFTNTREITFEKTITGSQRVFVDNSTLYQGTISEYTPYVSTGENFEVVTIVNSSPISDDPTFVADNSFSVFIKDIKTNIWSEWTETSSLFLESPTAKKYEKRLNENGNYEFKFGNDINGRALLTGDIVQIYYVTSSGEAGVIGANQLQNGKFVLYNSPTYNEIITNVLDSSINKVTPVQLPYILVNNSNSSSPISEAESVDEIRQNAPKIFSTQNRLVTRQDYEYFIQRSFNNIIKSTKVYDNDSYTREFLGYYYNIGLNKPNDDARVLFNQVAFSSSTSFNNVYIFTVPKISTIINEQIPNYLNLTQKQLIINECNLKKNLTSNVVCVDPIYKAFNIGLSTPGEKECVDLKDSSYLVIKKDSRSRSNNTTLREQVAGIIKSYFDKVQLGQLINLQEISSEILNIEGVKRISTRRVDIGLEVPRISMVVWNPSYSDEDVLFTTQNFDLEDFQFGYFYEISKLKDRIVIENE